MSHNLKIRLSGQPQSGGIVRCRNVTLRERMLRKLLGEPQKLMILIPGNSVDSLEINNTDKQGGCASHEQNQTDSRCSG